MQESTADPGHPTLLVIEDDRRLAEMITDFFNGQGFSANAIYRGDQAVARIACEQPDLVILDINLPGATGFDVCREARSSYRGKILMLTARDDDIDQIVGLELGADDYVIKPIQPRVLLARARTLLRRTAGAYLQKTADQGDVCFGALTISLANRRVRLGKTSIEMTTSEFELLALLAENASVIVSRNELFKSLYGREYDGLDRSVDVGISRLRKKLADDGDSPTRIKTVRGRGYLFVADAW